ncbi:unnamed protein product [Rhizoctonia solani]|uniref:Uncharacterized protein n=1 Tax=Rhizoctonia solani TaxID=456999 RepID=A0A8H3C1W0_9AGAM|nr:unnamed protein product [Rhizoctonia solani]
MTSRKDLSVSERIAALRRGSPQPQRPTSPPGTPPKLPASHSLKDKIAHFDSMGTAPRPSGSFGLGGPVEHRAASRELYGNRIPGVPHKSPQSAGGRDLSQLSNSSTSSFDHDAIPRDSPDGNPAASPTTDDGLKSESKGSVPEIHRTDSLTEHWVDAQKSKTGLAVDLASAATPGISAPPSPVPDSEGSVAGGPTTPLTSTAIRNLVASSHIPSRLGAETPVSIMVETGSLVDGEQPKLVPEEPGPVPPSPVATGMQLLGISDNGETTPTLEEGEAATKPDAVSSLAPPATNRQDEGPNTPLARPMDVAESVETAGLDQGQQMGSVSGLGISLGQGIVHGDELTARNVGQLDADPLKPAPSGPSSVIVEDGSVMPSPNPELHPGARTPVPPSAVTPKQGLSELPGPPPGTLPLSAASLRLLGIEDGKKSVRSGTETPMSILVETGSNDGKPRDLEGVEPPIATPVPHGSAASYFEEPIPDVVPQPATSVNIANSEPDNPGFSERGPRVPPKNVPAVVTSIKILADPMKTPTNTAPAGLAPMTTPTRASTTIYKSRSRPNLSSTSVASESAATGTAREQTLAAPNAGLQRRATIGSANNKPPRRRASRVPQMQLLPNGQWGVVDDDSDDEEDTGGWAKVTVTRSRWS